MPHFKDLIKSLIKKIIKGKTRSLCMTDAYPKKPARDNVNFFRNRCFNQKNKALIEAAAKFDTTFLLRHIYDQDLKHPEEYFDEKFSNRYGLQKIYELITINRTAMTILDIACGNAALLKELQKNGHNVIGIDISPVRILNNQRHIRKLYLALAEALPLEDESADIVVATEALEHVFDLDKTLKECYRVLKKGGEMFIQVPLENFADGTNHLRHFNENSIGFCLESYNFSIKKIKLIPYLTPPTPGWIGEGIIYL